MTSASDRTDDPIIVSSEDEGDEVTGPQVIHATIVHDDQHDEDEPAPENENAGPVGQATPEDQQDQPLPGDRPTSSDLPRRAWIPERPMPGSRRAGEANVAQSVPAQRAPFEPDRAEPDRAESEPDEPATETTEVPEPGQPEAAQADMDQPTPADLTPAEPGPAEPGSENPWPEIQSMFVDDPRRAVEQAAKVASTGLADLITAAKAVERTLGDDWRNEGTGTEELRVALRGYRDLGARIATLTRDFQRG